MRFVWFVWKGDYTVYITVVLVSCTAGNNLRKIRLVTLRAFLGLLHTSAGFEHGWCWPYMDVLTSTWLQLSRISILTSASGQWAAPVIGNAAI